MLRMRTSKQNIRKLSCYHNNRNKAFESQASWGRLEMKPNMSHQQKEKTYIKYKRASIVLPPLQNARGFSFVPSQTSPT